MASVVALAVVPGAAGSEATDPEPGTAAWLSRAADNHLYAQGRGLDQQTHPEYNARVLPLAADYLAGFDPTRSGVTTDPYRAHWGQERGTEVEARYRNRYGASISTHLWLPRGSLDRHRGAARRRMPAVVIVSGAASNENMYWGIAHGLAEAGYVVMTFDPQGDGASEARPQPESTYCDPGGEWRRPQELGVTERGPCAGVDPEGDPAADTAPLVTDRASGRADHEAVAEGYDRIRSRYFFGALDAVDWLLSASPAAPLIDPRRVGIAGHSLGGEAALLAGNGDPARRFAAAVVWDSYGRLLTPPRVPTMFQLAEGENLFGPRVSPPHPDDLPGLRFAEQFAAAGVDTMAVALRGSTHSEWAYIPYGTVNPFCVPGGCSASRDGERVALHYTLAWFDRYLKGRRPDGRGARQRSARNSAGARLTAERFDSSADESSIGQGSWDAEAGRNAPYSIGGERVRDHLSFYFRSWYSFDGLRCRDLRAGCGSVGRAPAADE